MTKYVYIKEWDERIFLNEEGLNLLNKNRSFQLYANLDLAIGSGNDEFIKYIHNINGPAWLSTDPPYRRFFINGEELTEYEWEEKRKKYLHDEEFNTKLKTLLEE